LIFLTLVLSVNLYSQDTKAANLYDDSYVSIGAGFQYHYFTSKDNFRNPTGAFGNSDEIKGVAGLNLNAELLLNKTFSLDLPVGIGAGYKFQTMSGGFEYSFLGGTVKRTVDITNHIAFIDVYLPLDSEKYWLIGGTAGIGASEYAYKLDYSSTFSDVEKSSNGFVVPLGVFLDWGADGIGGRLGYTYVFSKYSDIDGVTPKGNGSQFYIELRYAI
ncbi:MAG TPA: hypothetical protein PLY36_11945, partial [Spirochaetota bacterium]|nr:hypothetical protein [Spirochaetota bacterium]